MRQATHRRVMMLVVVMALTGTFSSSAVASDTVHQNSPVIWHAQQAALGNTGQVSGASASLVRNGNGIAYRLNTNSFDPGGAYTLWLVVINNPAACAAIPCTAADIILNPDTRSQVRYAAGNVAGGSGKGTLAGHVNVGPISGWLPGRTLEDPLTAEIHLVVNHHGPMIPEMMPGMIQTYRGGCSGASPFPPVFPASALADGEAGPNICRLFQAAVFLAP